MANNYVVNVFKPTAVSIALTGNFTASNELNLILIKGNNLVVHLVTAEGLKKVVDVDINGRISIAKLIRPQVSTLFISICSTPLHFLVCIFVLATVQPHQSTSFIQNGHNP